MQVGSLQEPGLLKGKRELGFTGSSQPDSLYTVFYTCTVFNLQVTHQIEPN